VVHGSDLFVLVRRAPGLACRVRGGILAGAGTVPPCDVDDSSSSDAIRSAERRAFSSYQGEREREKILWLGLFLLGHCHFLQIFNDSVEICVIYVFLCSCCSGTAAAAACESREELKGPSRLQVQTEKSMEEVEVANRAAVETCHRVLALLSQQQDPALLRSIASETGEACAKFRKVAALLGDSSGGSGHARARFSRRARPLGFFNHKGFSGSSGSASSAAPSPSTSYAQLRARINGASESRGLDLASSSGAHQFGPPKLVQPLSVQFQIGNVAHRYPFPQQPPRQKLQAEMFKRSNSGISLKFDSPCPSGATGTMSSARSFMSSLSMDGSVVSLEGKRPFHLVGAPAADVQNVPKRRCMGKGEDGRGKCAATGRCHCSKRR
jgi:hypothetical protein